MRSRIVGSLVLLLVIVTLSWWRSERADKLIPKPAQDRSPLVQQPAEDRNRDDDVQVVLRQGVAAFRKMLKDNPKGDVNSCSNAADCAAKIPGLKIPAGIRMNLSLSNHGEVSGEAGRAGSGRSYQYYEGAASVTTANKEAREWVLDAEGNPTPIPEDGNRDEEVQSVLRQAVATYRKLLTDNPDSDVTYCYSAGECAAKIPGLKVPAGIKMNLGKDPDGSVGGEAGLAGSGRSYQYTEGRDAMKETKHEAYESYPMQ